MSWMRISNGMATKHNLSTAIGGSLYLGVSYASDPATWKMESRLCVYVC